MHAKNPLFKEIILLQGSLSAEPYNKFTIAVVFMKATSNLRCFNFESSLKLRWRRARDFYFLWQIPVTTGGFERRTLLTYNNVT